MYKNIHYISSLILSAFVLSFGNAFGFNCQAPSAAITLEINNVRAQLMNGGDMFRDEFGSNYAKYEIPKNSGKHSCYAGAIWISALDFNGNLHTAGQTYRQRGNDFWAGPLNNMGETQELTCREWDKMYSVTGLEVNNAKFGKEISYNVSRWPSAFAPFFDKNGDGVYDPSLGDYPVLDPNNITNIPGQMAFWVFNDNGNLHTAYVDGLNLGVEVKSTAYAYFSNSSDIINNSTIYKYNITNKSINTYYDFRFGKFLDLDIGNPADDYIGCDLSVNTSGIKRNLFYGYNGDSDDENGFAIGYGTCPPAIGITFLNSGKNGSGDLIPMGAFIPYKLLTPQPPGFGGEPREAFAIYNFMHGLWPDNTIIGYGTNDARIGFQATMFAFPGDTDPDGRPAWYETYDPGDRTFVVSTAGAELLPGAIRTIEYAIVWARDSNATATNLTNLEKLRVSTDTIISAYKNNFSSFSLGVENVRKVNLVLYPNPSNESIQVKGLLVKSHAKIYNKFGQVIKEFDLEPNQKIMIYDLAEGIYYLKLDKQVLKFLKN